MARSMIFRRTIATGMQRLGVRLEIIETVLGHVSGSRAGIVGTYQKHRFEVEAADAVRRWGEHITGTAGRRACEGGRVAARAVVSDARKAAVRKAIERLRALKPDVPTEKPWTPMQSPGVYMRDGETISNPGAQWDWLDNNDPRQIGEAAARRARRRREPARRGRYHCTGGQGAIANAQRHQGGEGASRPLDRPLDAHAVAGWHEARRGRTRDGQAVPCHRHVVRRVWARPKMREEAMLVAAQVAVLAKKHTSN